MKKYTLMPILSLALGVLFVSCSGTGTGDTGTGHAGSADAVTFTMVLVPGGHSFPTGISNSGSATVSDAYWIGETEVTYELWHTVYTWATGNGYTFANAGTMGDGTGDTDQHPVTTVNWRDAMLWCNALTEWYNAEHGTGYSQVYYSDSGYNTPIRNVDDTESVSYPDPGGQDDPYVDSGAKGFRLLTCDEWELAARWRDDSTNTVTGYSDPWFTKGRSASGATAAFYNAGATGAVAWYGDNSGSSTHEVKGKTSNALGLYDMSGNVYEWCFDWYPDHEGSSRARRGGSWDHDADELQIGSISASYPYGKGDRIGFRFGRTH
ncbi:MAG: formylglycine-generating enzyme family protein [Spirochaetaceae bacterium]